MKPKDVFVDDGAARADAAIVIGAPDEQLLQHRIAAAIALVHAKKTRVLLLTGDGRARHVSQQSEAARMQAAALTAGIADDAIVLDDEANDPVAMARNCSKLIKTHPRLQGIRSLYLVSSAWHLLRMKIVMEHHLPSGISAHCHPATAGITAANWQTTDQGRATIQNELRLIEKLLSTGYSLP